MSTNKTRFLGLDYLGQGDSVVDDDYKFGVADRDRLDLMAYLGASAHRHDGQAILGTNAPLIGPALTLDQTQGFLPANTTIYYKFSLVDEHGVETLASPETYYTTPANIETPAAPTVTALSTGGTLLPGTYAYGLTAYGSATSLETTVSGFALVTLPVGGTTYRVQLNLPPLPTDASGFNVYRRAIGETSYHYLASVDMQVATPPFTYTDTGAVTVSPTRGLPTSNNTNTQNSISVTFPAATPAVPLGFTWRVYRTYTAGYYVSSLLHSVVEETSEGSGIITPTYLDLGLATTTGQPLSSLLNIDGPDPIHLGDGAEVQGTLPLGMVAAFPFEVQLREPAGAVAVRSAGTFVWVCEFPAAAVVGVRATLGRGSSPASTAILVDVNKYNASAATPTWATIFPTQAQRPTILVGHEIGTQSTPEPRVTLVKGDALTVDIDQAGGGATPTDSNLTVTVSLLVYGYPTSDSIDASTDSVSLY